MRALAHWPGAGAGRRAVPFLPARVILQDFTGVPAVVDLAAMRAAVARAGRDPARRRPAGARRPRDRPLRAGRRVRHALRLRPQHRARVRAQRRALRAAALGAGRVRELPRRAARHGHRPPGQPRAPRPRRAGRATGVARARHAGRHRLAHDDDQRRSASSAGASAASRPRPCMLGEPLVLGTPSSSASSFSGALRAGVTATDLVLTLTEMLRKHGVVGKFVEFCGDGLSALSLADRATLSNMAPEYGATAALFPVDDETLRYLRADRPRRRRARWSRRTARRRACSARDGDPTPDLQRAARCSTSTPSSRASPARAARRTACALGGARPASRGVPREPNPVRVHAARSRADGIAATAVLEADVEVDHGSVVIAAITSCTNTSNPSVMVAAGPARAQRGRARPASRSRTSRRASRRARASSPTTSERAGPRRSRSTRWASTSSATAARPASATPARCPTRSPQAVRRARPGGRLRALGQPQLRGPHPPAGARELPRLAAAGRRLRAGRARSTSTSTSEPLGTDRDGEPVYLRDLWPTAGGGARRSIDASITPELFETEYAHDLGRRRALAAHGRADGRAVRLGSPTRPTSASRRSSATCSPEPEPLTDVVGARVPGRCSATRSRPTTSRRRARSRPTMPGRPLPASSTASSRATSTRSARAAATTR